MNRVKVLASNISRVNGVPVLRVEIDDGHPRHLRLVELPPHTRIAMNVNDKKQNHLRYHETGFDVLGRAKERNDLAKSQHAAQLEYSQELYDRYLFISY